MQYEKTIEAAAGRKDFNKVSELLAKGINADELRKSFKTSNITTREDCSKCWAKYYCSGGCVANGWQFNKNINIPYKIGCELEKKRVEVALWIKTK